MNNQTAQTNSAAPTNFWVLRSGDFRPERLCDYKPKNMGYPSEQHAVQELKAAGNLFDTERDAIEASITIRAELKRLEFIRQEQREYIRRRGIRFRNDELYDQESRAQGINRTKVFNRDPMPGHEYLTIGRVEEILDSIPMLADAYAYSTTDRRAVNDLIGRVILGWSMEFKLRKGERLRDSGKQDIQLPNL